MGVDAQATAGLALVGDIDFRLFVFLDEQQDVAVMPQPADADDESRLHLKLLGHGVATLP
jgi:hypothetical protein